MRTSILIVIKLSVSIGLILFIYRNTPTSDIKTLLASIEIAYVPIIVMLLFLNTIISAKKWQLFLAADHVQIPLIDLTITYMSGTFCSLFLPSSIGGDTYRVYDIAQRSKQGVRSAVSVFADRFSGFVALVTLSLLSSLYMSVSLDTYQFLFLPIVLTLIFSLVIIFITNHELFRRCLRITRLAKITVVERLAEKMLLSFVSYRSNKLLLVRVMILSFIFQLCLILAVYLMACALGAEVPFFYFSAFVPLITLMEALPISIYGIGVRDYGYVFFFTQVGMSDIETRSLALFFMATAVCYSLVGGLFFLYKVWRQPRAT